MSWSDTKFAEAIAELRRRLDQLGVETAAEVSHDFMRDLVRQGWRPVAPAVEQPRGHGHRPTTEQLRAYADQARASIRAASEGGSDAL